MRPLTARQKRVLILHGRGFNYKEIGEQLGISRQAVHDLVRRASDFLGAENKFQAFALALYHKQISLDVITGEGWKLRTTPKRDYYDSEGKRVQYGHGSVYRNGTAIPQRSNEHSVD